MVNKGTRVHAQIMEGVKRTVSFAEAAGVPVKDVSDYCKGCADGCARCSQVTSYNIGAGFDEMSEQAYAPGEYFHGATDGTNRNEVEVLRNTVERLTNKGIRMPTALPVAASERVYYHRKLIKFNGMLNDNRVTFMIDTGSEIDVCPQHIYNRLQSPPLCRTDMTIFLKGMNGPGKKMRGVMENCEIKIGNMSVQSNLHLHDEGPNCIILGQPFLHQARFEHFWDGERPNVRFTTEEGSVEFPYTQGAPSGRETEKEVVESNQGGLTLDDCPRSQPF